MNKLTIIGNLTGDPEMRTTQSGKNVCNFTVAVNRKKTPNNQNPGADYFRISAWEQRGEVCAKYLSKGKKVCVVGPVSVRAYTNSKGEPAGQMEVTADEIEFLSPAGEQQRQPAQDPPRDEQTGYEQVTMEQDELPF